MDKQSGCAGIRPVSYTHLTSHQLFTESVMDEVLLSMDNEDETVADEILKQFDLLLSLIHI